MTKELREEMAGLLKDHICRFNDAPQECSCFKEALSQATILAQRQVIEELLGKMKNSSIEVVGNPATTRDQDITLLEDKLKQLR